MEPSIALLGSRTFVASVRDPFVCWHQDRDEFIHRKPSLGLPNSWTAFLRALKTWQETDHDWLGEEEASTRLVFDYSSAVLTLALSRISKADFYVELAICMLIIAFFGCSGTCYVLRMELATRGRERTRVY